MTEKKVYSDEEIGARIYRLTVAQTIDFGEDACTAAMLQQLLDERKAILKDLKALEDEVEDNMVCTEVVLVDCTRSEKYDTEKAD